MIDFYNEIAILLIMSLVGYLLLKTKLLNKSMLKGLSAILIYAALPCLLYDSFSSDTSKEIFKNFSKAILYVGAIYLLALIIAFVFFKGKDKDRIIMRQSLIFSNCVFMGVPIVQSIFGQEGVIYTSIFVMFFNILLWTYGIKELKSGVYEKKNLRKLLLNPGIIAIVIGIIALVTGFKTPYFAAKTISILGGLTTPLAMIIIGGLFEGTKILNILKNKKVAIITIVRLLVFPIIILFGFKLFGLSGIDVEVIIILSAMPVATTVAIIAEQYDVSPIFASGIVVYSTVASVITLPFIYFLIGKII